MAKLIQLSEIAFKKETTTTEGTPQTLSNANCVMPVYDITYKPNIEFYRRSTRSNYFSRFPGVAGKRMASIGFKFDLIGNTAAHVAPAWATLANSAGIISTAATNQMLLTPASRWNPLDLSSNNDFDCLTMGFYTDGRYREITGARPSSFKIVAEAGKPLRGEVEFIGAAANDPSTVALLTGMTWETGTSAPPIFMSASLSLGTLAAAEALVSTFTLDFGLTTAMRDDANSATGYRSAMVTDRKPTFAFDPEMTTISEHDFYAILKAGTTAALALAIGASDNKIAISAPAVQYVDMSEGERNGILTAEMTCDLCRSSGNDEFTITLGT